MEQPAAENLYAALKDSIASASAPVRIGEVNQESTSESITQRGLGFIDKFSELASADGKKVAVVGNEFYVNGAKDKGDEASADIIIEVAVPAQTTVELCATEASAIMNKADVIGIFGSNQVAAEGILSADANLNKLGTEAGKSIRIELYRGLMLSVQLHQLLYILLLIRYVKLGQQPIEHSSRILLKEPVQLFVYGSGSTAIPIFTSFH